MPPYRHESDRDASDGELDIPFDANETEERALEAARRVSAPARDTRVWELQADSRNADPHVWPGDRPAPLLAQHRQTLCAIGALGALLAISVAYTLYPWSCPLTMEVTPVAPERGAAAVQARVTNRAWRAVDLSIHGDLEADGVAELRKRRPQYRAYDLYALLDKPDVTDRAPGAGAEAESRYESEGQATSDGKRHLAHGETAVVRIEMSYPLDRPAGYAQLTLEGRGERHRLEHKVDLSTIEPRQKLPALKVAQKPDQAGHFVTITNDSPRPMPVELRTSPSTAMFDGDAQRYYVYVVLPGNGAWGQPSYAQMCWVDDPWGTKPQRSIEPGGSLQAWADTAASRSGGATKIICEQTNGANHVEETVSVPEVTDEQTIAEAERQKGAGRLREAKQLLVDLLRRSPENIRAHYLLAWIHAELKERTNARSEFQAVLNLASPESEEYREARAALERLRWGNAAR